jgi:tetratricopeptide (TPR) repeat protein
MYGKLSPQVDCGIIRRMTNQHLDETQPNEPNRPDETAADHPASKPVADDRLEQTSPARATSSAGEPETQLEEPSRSATSPADAAAAFTTAAKPRKRGLQFGLTIVLGLVALVAVATLSAFGGYNAGISDRLAAEGTQLADETIRQYGLGIQDLEAGRYEIARQRFEYIISIAPEFPGAVDRLADAMLGLNATATPTIVPTPTITPTPDLRDVQSLFEESIQAMQASEWTTAIDNLLALRKKDPTYNSVAVDGMLYVALRNRGVDKILRLADLEGGTYDLALAERFGPLDAEARNYRIWVNLYVTGASFWEIDWSNAVFYFSQVAPMAPGLRDASGWTAAQRYVIALTSYGDLLADQDEWCRAEEMYRSALTAGADGSVETKAVEAAQRCLLGVEEEDDDQPPGDGREGLEPTPTPEGDNTAPPGDPTPTPESYP